MKAKNAIYAQSGGVTSVINATAGGVIEAARKSKRINKLFAGKNGIRGLLREDIIDTSIEDIIQIKKLQHTPGGIFGSCRHKLKDPSSNKKEYERLIEVFRAHDIGYFFYNGGGDSQDTTNKISQFTIDAGFPVNCIGIPKTVDNDLPYTDNCPGFGSVAKYVATSVREASLDVESMSESSTKVFIMEVMGRHAGWIAASSGLAQDKNNSAPHIILLPEVPFYKAKFLKRVKDTIKKHGFCVIVVSEGARFKNGEFIADAGTVDSFGHKQLGGVAPTIAGMIKDSLGLKYHWAVSDYLQRAARHISSKTDVDQAYAVGKAAVQFALSGENAVMPIIKRTSSNPYSWKIDKVKLSQVANVEKKLPQKFISKNGFGVTEACKNYLRPLIQGEAYPPYKDGVIETASLKNKLVKKKLKTFKV
ncbi:6-phosphofructokinase [Gammaproteobacteria bacterium]|nr:6-phosphofructokinase [SAR86 cluster bacterium]MDA7554045.1 6-phosphofructokinase [Gammaproteobacteria bacterium]MDB3880637.1 6-phosphofructokinase [Gammaproteobacteria bacterium]MDB4815905.1 6-phosphofructokinase [Gammaproteobacteria bacterium]MDC0509767.1 6-phosphofructokinase [Gammaproteobacteria bacterium]|tara:strand:+ start:288 stop:1544 length:1257 start_codon:yes stop_codon:yes gene_type:complete